MPAVFERPCPSCGGVAHRLFQKFQAPRSNNVKHLKVVRFLYDHGFWFQTLSDTATTRDHGEYPRTLDDARFFVHQFRAQAVNKALLRRVELENNVAYYSPWGYMFENMKKSSKSESPDARDARH